MKTDQKRTKRRIAGGLLIWGFAVAAAANSGLLSAIPRQFGAALAVIGIIVPAIIYFRSSVIREYIRGLGIKTLTTFHIWRIGAGLVFLFYGGQKLLPDVFVFNAGYGDIGVGLLAGVLLLLPEIRLKYWVFHLIGMADFIIAISTGLTLVLIGDKLMNNLFTLPVVLIPLFGVGVSGAVHIFAFDLLIRNPDAAPAEALAA